MGQLHTRIRRQVRGSIQHLAFVTLLTASLVLGACKNVSPSATSTVKISEPPTPTPTAPSIDKGLPVAPQVLEQTPPAGGELAVDGGIELLFDQDMDTGKTSSALRMIDSKGEEIQGNITWPDPHNLNFKPDHNLSPGEQYRVYLSEKAVSKDGIAIREPLSLRVNTVGNLSVTQVFPSEGALGVGNNSIITVIFNRPVVPLVIAEEQATLPQPLQIDPPIKGHGEWINTSVYTYIPDGHLNAGVTYTVMVNGGLQDASQQTALKEDFSWTFTTLPARIESFDLNRAGITNPSDMYSKVLVDEYFTIRFLQPMDPTSAMDAIQITSSNGENVNYKSSWNEDSTSVLITPTQHLALDTQYLLKVDKSAQSSSGGDLQEGLDWNFFTIPPPGVEWTSPANGETNSNKGNYFNIQFASPMNLESLKKNVILSPAPKDPVEWWYNDYDWSYSTYSLQPSTSYTVQVLPGAMDIYSNTLKVGKTIRFSTSAENPAAYLQMPYDISLFRAGAPDDAGQFYINYRNIKTIQLDLYKLSDSVFTGLMSGKIDSYTHQPPQANLVWQQKVVGSADLNQQVLQPYHPTIENGDPLPLGAYFLGLNTPELNYQQPFDDHRLLVVANANLTFKTTANDSLLWLTDLTTGEPLAGVPITIYDKDYQSLATGETDKDGLLSLELPPPSDPWEPRYAIARSEDAVNPVYTVASSQWYNGISYYDSGIWIDYYQPANQIKAYVYTDRPIYRPGQPVYLKGIIRQDDDLDYTLPDVPKIHVKVENYKGVVFEQDLSLSTFGTFDGQFTLEPQAALGYYNLIVTIPEKTDPIGTVTFNVAEYRKPEFQIQVSASPQNVLSGDTYKMTASASYYSGGPVAGAQVSWTLNSQDFTFTPESAWSGYTFTNLEDDVCCYSSTQAENKGIIAQGNGKTDSQGNFVITLPADLSAAKSSQRFTFEATVTDLSTASATGRANIVAHLGEIYPGIRSSTYVGESGKPASLELVALDWVSKPIANQQLTVDIVERRWHSVQEQDATGRIQWKSTVEDIPVEIFNNIQTNEEGEASISFIPPNGGVYRARVSATDKQGNQNVASTYLWVAGDEYIPWQQTNDRSLRLVSDKKSYNPGDVAEVLIASPFQGKSYALVTVERGRVRKQEVISIDNNSTIYHLPVTPDMAPNAYVSVLLIKGVDEFNPRPNFKLGTLDLEVAREQKMITVEIKPDRIQAGPGESVTYSISTRDYQGNPLSVELSLGLSDLASLSLADPNSPPILDYFYSKRSLNVWTTVPIQLSIEEYNAFIEEYTQEGTGGGSGGGKGEGYLGVEQIRQDFPDTAYWEAHLVTDKDGKASVTVTLPDNLTTWRMDARAVSLDTLVGQVTSDLVSTKPLLIRPQTPRFFVVGDQTRLGTAVHNNTSDALVVDVALLGSGLQLLSPATQQIEIPANSQAFVYWEAQVDLNSKRVDITFSAGGTSSNGTKYEDASLPPQGSLDKQGIPVYDFEVPETVGTSGQVNQSGTLVENIYLPKAYPVASGDLEIELSPSLAAGMTEGLTYLKTYPYACMEQIISSFLPNVITTRALNTAGLSDPELEKELEKQVNLSLQRIYNSQNPDGGWGWWEGGKSSVETSAYVLLGLVEAQNAGYTVNQKVVEQAKNYLKSNLVSINSLVDPHLANQQAFNLYVLARSGSPEVSKSVQLYDQRHLLAYYSRAYLAQALFLIDPQDTRIHTLLSDLNNTAITSATGSHWEEEQVDPWDWNTDTRTTAIILSTLSYLDPTNPLNANAVRWLMDHRTQGHWNTTQETAWTLMALTNWMEASGELEANYNYAVELNGQRLADGTANQDNLREPINLQVDVKELISGQANRLAIARDEGQGNLYYTAHLSVPLPVEQVQPLDQGVIVSRNYYEVDDLKTQITQAKVGDLVFIKLTIVAPNDLHYVLVEDPLPAGLEAVDQSLKTSQQNIDIPQAYSLDEINSQGWGWWSFENIELRDEKVSLSASYLPAGTYVYTYLARASTPGSYRTIPPTAQEFYFPEVYGRGTGSLFVVNP